MFTWIDDRWHLDGRPIHAGSALELRWPDGTWEVLRVESGDRGRKLYAHFSHRGVELCLRVDPEGQRDDVELRWPK